MRVYTVLLSVIISISYFHYSHSATYTQTGAYPGVPAAPIGITLSISQSIGAYVTAPIIEFIFRKLLGLENITGIIPSNG